ncbi:hypothetical protein CSOJ01_00166 [Colletotrichum sojae]|uniref:Uncharacterized protein n=1 Tax=Colletotrichum sojae TaxID=2175907 RepID=A0A8H6JZM5_9PEZI|nr:hypothetical protein CSOJ01_00166 [Colletotrichum sojae]
MRPLYGFIPRLYAPPRTLTRQSFGPSPAANATTGTFGLSNRMSTSSGPQSSLASSKLANGAAEEARKANGGQEEQALPDEGHRQHHPTKSTSPAPENATSSAPAADNASTDSSQPRPQQQPGQPLALPPLPELPTSGNSAGAPPTTVLDLGGQQGGGASTKLDHLGPLVVHQDGTMSRINNWGEMTEIERQNTLRILGKRNQIRLATLRDGAGGEGQRG